MSRAERELTPHRSALDRFGYELRTWRKARGLSQDRLGASVHVSGDLVRLIEVAERRPTRDFAERCDRVLDTLGTFVRLWEAVENESPAARRAAVDTDNHGVGTDKSAEPMTAQAAGETIVVQMTSLTGEPIPVAIDRRTFMAGVAALPAVGWLGRGTLGTAGLPAPVSDGDLTDVLRTMANLRATLTAQDNMLGPGAVAPTVVHQTSILQHLSKTASGQARDALMSLQAAYAEFAGWLADDLGDRRVGQFWTDRALEWAHEADDDLIVGYILMRKAQRAIDSGDAAAAGNLARAAQRRGALTPRVRAGAAQFEAQGHALSGDGMAFQASIDQARELVLSAPPPVSGEWALWCTPGYVDIHEAAGWMRLGEPARAVTVYEQALTRWPAEFRRDEGVYYGRLARAYAAAGRPEQAADAGRTALGIAGRTGSARIVTELEPLPAALDQWRRLPAVRTFASELHDALAGPATTKA